MITIEKIIKANGELHETKKQPVIVENRQELEAFRKKMEIHYGTQIIFKYVER